MSRRQFLSTLLQTAGALALPAMAWPTPALARATQGGRRGIAPLPLGYQNVGIIEQVPPAILYGVALQESSMLFGRNSLPYPWTLNVAGTPRRFGSYEAAVAGLRTAVARGITSVDCGLMQVNWRYHYDKLGTYFRALDPYPNLAIGARLLRGHFNDTGNWFTSVGRYHNGRDQARAHAYATSVFQRIAVLHA